MRPALARGLAGARPGPAALPALAVALLVAVAACRSEVAADLDADEAGEVVAALERNGIGAARGPQPGTAGRFAITVPAADAARGRDVLRAEELPRSRRPLEAALLGGCGLVPTEAEERARIAAAVAADLGRTLERVRGVVSAQVHIALPPPARFAALGAPASAPAAPDRRPTASVLLKVRLEPGGGVPLAAADARRLVAAAVDGLAPADVSVVTVPAAPLPPPRSTAAAEAAGPLSLPPGSAAPVRVALVALSLVVAALGGLLVLCALHIRRLRRRSAPP